MLVKSDDLYDVAKKAIEAAEKLDAEPAKASDKRVEFEVILENGESLKYSSLPPDFRFDGPVEYFDLTYFNHGSKARIDHIRIELASYHRTFTVSGSDRLAVEDFMKSNGDRLEEMAFRMDLGLLRFVGGAVGFALYFAIGLTLISISNIRRYWVAYPTLFLIAALIYFLPPWGRLMPGFYAYVDTNPWHEVWTWISLPSSILGIAGFYGAIVKATLRRISDEPKKAATEPKGSPVPAEVEESTTSTNK